MFLLRRTTITSYGGHGGRNVKTDGGRGGQHKDLMLVYGEDRWRMHGGHKVKAVEDAWRTRMLAVTDSCTNIEPRVSW